MERFFCKEVVLQQPVALVDFCTTGNAKIPIIGAAANLRFDGVCRVKNRLAGDFSGFYAQSATNSWVFKKSSCLQVTYKPVSKATGFWN
jgi:hypothetical protein